MVVMSASWSRLMSTSDSGGGQVRVSQRGESGSSDTWGAGEEVAEVAGVRALVVLWWAPVGWGYAAWRARTVATAREMKILWAQDRNSNTSHAGGNTLHLHGLDACSGDSSQCYNK